MESPIRKKEKVQIVALFTLLSGLVCLNRLILVICYKCYPMLIVISTLVRPPISFCGAFYRSVYRSVGVFSVHILTLFTRSLEKDYISLISCDFPSYSVMSQSHLSVVIVVLHRVIRKSVIKEKVILACMWYLARFTQLACNFSLVLIVYKEE